MIPADGPGYGEPVAEIERQRAHIEQLQAKLHCMCGSEIDHSGWEGHTPVSVYDYALDLATTEIDRLRALNAEMLAALEEARSLLNRVNTYTEFFCGDHVKKLEALIARATP